MEKNKKKKFRDIRNAIVMMCVMAAMISTASYAWFTLSDSPTVTNMQMTAATSGGGLLVANVTQQTGVPGTDNFKSSINIADEEIKILKPVTPGATSGKLTFKSPVYTGNTVTDLADIPDAELTNYVAKYEYWIKSTDTAPTGNVGIGIICGATDQAGELKLVNDGDVPGVNGSLVRKNTDRETTATVDAPYAVRVGFVVSEVANGTTSADLNKIVIWEPNSDIITTTTQATSDVTVTEDVKMKSTTEGTITLGGSGNISDALFTMSKGGAVKVTMYIWLEGSDPQCGDEIQAGTLEAQVQFTAIDLAEGNTP